MTTDTTTPTPLTADIAAGVRVLREWVRRAEVCGGLTAADAELMAALERYAAADDQLRGRYDCGF